MPIQQQQKSSDVESSSLRHLIFYRLNLFSNVAFFLLILVGVIFVHILVPIAQTRNALTVVLAVLAMLIAIGQLFTMVFTYSAIASPIEKLMLSIESWSQDVANRKPEEVDVNKIRAAISSVECQAKLCAQKMPRELQKLQATFVHTLKLMESAWQKAEVDAIMVGLGGVCAQVAHDMRSPAATIKILSKVVMNVETPADRKEMSDMLGFSAVKLNAMADELLSYRKSSAVELKPIDLSNIIRDTCRELQVLAHGKNVQLVCNIPADQDFFGDADKMGRMIQNLVGNAIQAVEKQANGRVEVNMVRGTDQIHLNIQDNGTGIPSEFVDKMFKAGFTTKGEKGNGLGLIYCANVVKAHGGQINARNRSEGGAEISIILPMQIAH